MVRTLDSALTSALNNVSRVPAFKLTIEDHVIHYGSYQTPGAADAWNDACVASDNSIIRVQVPRGGSGYVSAFQVQRITDPSQSSQWTSWATLPGSSGLMFVNPVFAMHHHRFCNRAEGTLHRINRAFAIKHCSSQRSSKGEMPDADCYKIPPHNFS